MLVGAIHKCELWERDHSMRPKAEVIAEQRKRTRFHQIFVTHLRAVKGRLMLAGLCTLAVTLAELLKPWPLKIILDHGILNKKLPHFLSFLDGLMAQGKVTLIVAASCAIVLIAVCG